MKFNDLLADGYGRIRERVHQVLDGLDADQLAARPGGDSNSIAWLIWHLTRIQDDHIADVAGTRQYWLAGWSEQFDLPLAEKDHGYGHTSEQVASVQVESADLLRGYYDDVHAGTLAYLAGLTEDDLDRIVDTRWEPHVKLGVRLVSVLDDCLEHVGQAAYVKGMLARGEA
ncbi:MAG: mycothiol transferase [Actinomycetota bacterium]